MLETESITRRCPVPAQKAPDHASHRKVCAMDQQELAADHFPNL
jgi:hypothetical protein